MSVQADAPLPPAKDIPATLRLGTNLLGLGIGPMPGEEEVQQRDGESRATGLASTSVVVISSPSSARAPNPTLFVPLRTTSLEPLTSPPAPHDARPSSPSTPRSNKQNNRIAEPYHQSSQSSSTASLSATSTRTITPGSPSTRGAGSARMLDRRSSSEWGGIRGGTSSERIERPMLTSSASSSAVPSAGRKRSSGQLLTGLGRGLGRMGSVMRRNTSEAIGETKTRTWRRKGKSRETVLEENEDEWEPTRARRPSQYRIDPIPGDEGDAGIGRPYNVAHDLHVSPSLEDLPPAWLRSLRAQGLSEQDLMLIASARKRQQAVTSHAISVQNNRTRLPHLSEPPKSLHSMPMSVGGSSTHLVLGGDEWRQRGTSTLETGITSLNTSQGAFDALSTSVRSSAAALGLPPQDASVTSVRLLKKFSFEPSSKSASIIEEDVPLVGSGPFQGNLVPAKDVEWTALGSDTTPAEMPNFGAAQRRTSKKTKRLSDQLRCFSQFHIGDEEGWAASLLSVMDAEVPASSSPLQVVPATAHTDKTGNGAKIQTPSNDSSALQLSNTASADSGIGGRSVFVVASIDGSRPMATPHDKVDRNISTPPLLPQTTPESALNPPAMGRSPTRSSFRSWPSPRPPRPAPMPLRAAAETNNPITPSSSVQEPGLTPLRKSSDSFGVHYSQSKSSVELDLVTPSSSSHPERQPSPPSSDEDDEGDEGAIGVDDNGSVLDFAGALRAAGFDYTPGSNASKELKEYLPGLFNTPSPSHGLLSRRSRPTSGGRAEEGYTPRSQHDPVYSVPASVSSCMPSRSTTPELAPYTSAHARTPMSVTTKDERTSAAYSVVSSDSGHQHNSLHEATVQTAYTKVLSRLQEVQTDPREGASVVRRGSSVKRIAEESEYSDGDGDARTDEDEQSEAGNSAICALDDAARRFADVHV